MPLLALNKLWFLKRIPDELENKKINAGDALGENNVDPLFYFVPIGIKAGANYAPFVRVNADNSSGGNLIGINTEIQFIKNTSLLLGVERINAQIKISDDDPAGFDKYPIATPNEPGDILHELKGDFNYLQIPVGIKKSFLNKNKLKPFASLGLVALRPYKQAFVYEYINGTGEYKLTSNLSRADLK